MLLNQVKRDHKYIFGPRLGRSLTTYLGPIAAPPVVSWPDRSIQFAGLG